MFCNFYYLLLVGVSTLPHNRRGNVTCWKSQPTSSRTWKKVHLTPLTLVYPIWFEFDIGLISPGKNRSNCAVRKHISLLCYLFLPILVYLWSSQKITISTFTKRMCICSSVPNKANLQPDRRTNLGKKCTRNILFFFLNMLNTSYLV